MEDHTGNTPRTLTHQKTDFYDSATESDEGVCNRKWRYWRDDGSRTETSPEGPSDQLTTNRKRHTGDHKIINVLDKRIYYKTVNAYEDKINMLINSQEKISTFLNSVGLDTNIFIQDFKQRTKIFQKSIKKYDYSQDFINFGKLEWFLDHYINKNVLQDKHKTIETPKIKNIFRSLSPVVSNQAKIDESGEDSYNLISSIVVIQGGIVTYSRHYKTICCVRIDGERNDIHCPSSVTDFTRIGEETVLATLPFRQMILIISPSSWKIKTLPVGFYKVCYLEHSTFIGVEMFNKTIFLTDWDNNRITSQFIAKEIPADIALGPQNNLLISFANINRVTSYTLDGQQLFEVYTNSLDIPTHITVYQNHFYALQGHIIYRISGTGDVSHREIGMKYQQISVGSNTIFLIDYFGVPRTIRMTKDFWPRPSYNNQLRTPTFNDHIYTEDSHNITSILPVSSSSILIFYRNMKAILITDIEEKISQKYLTFPFVPSVCCRLNSNTFLVFYHANKKLQVIKCPELTKGHLINVHADYIKLCHVVSNKCLALTTSKSKEEVHILLVKEDKVDIINRIPLEHGYVTIAATPINFVVVDGRKHKLVFYSLSGEVLFEKYLQFYGYPHHIYTDNVYYYVLFKSESLVICYDIYGEIKWQWKLPLTICPHVAVFQGTIYMVDIVLNRVLLYKYHDWSGCRLLIKNPYIKNLNIRLDGNANNKVVIAEICHLPNGQLVMSDINNDCLLFISNEGDIVSTFSLPSTATDIYRWDCNQIGVTLPLEKQLQVVGNLSKRVRTVSLRRPYLRVRKLGKGQIFCYCDKPSHHLDIVSIRKCNQGEIIWTLKIPFVVKSLAIENESLNILIVTKKKVFKYTSDRRRSHRHRHHRDYGRTRRINLKPTVLLSQIKHSLSLYGGCIDKMFIYLIDNCRMFAINDHNLVVRDHVTNNQLNMYIDFVDVFSRNICISEMLSSTIYLQDLTVSDKARHVDVPPCFGDKFQVEIYCLIITENNLIAGYDVNNKNIKIFTFDGQLLDSVKLNVDNVKMCRWQSNTLVIATHDDDNRLLTLKVEFPLSLITYQTRNKYLCIASLSDNLLVCSIYSNNRTLYVVDIDEIYSTVNVKNRIVIPETLTRDRGVCSNDISYISAITVTANDDIIVGNTTLIIFFNRKGQYLHSVRHYMSNTTTHGYMTTDDCYLYINSKWERYVNYNGYDKTVCLTKTGEYNSIFLNKTRCKDIVDFTCINCKGPRFVGRHWSTWKLYVEGLFNVNRERYPVCRLQTDNRPVQVKDIDISDEGHTVVCENANTGNIKIFDRDGELLCYRDLGTLVGGVCYTRERDIMVTVPNRREIFQLKQHNLAICEVWQSRVPYGIICKAMGNIYWCVHINLTKYHCIKFDGDKLEVLKSVSLLKLDSDLHFSSITSQTNNEIFSDELINKLTHSGEDGGGSGESGKIVGKSRLKVRCGNYIAETMSGIDEISVRKLPYRTAMVPLSIPTWDEPVNYDIEDSRDYSSKLIKLDDNVSVLMFRDTVTIITTATGDILQHKQLLQHQPLDICRWTDECFIVTFGKQLMFSKRDLSPLKTINTEKYYNRIYKKNYNQLVCGGHFIGDIPEGGGYQYYVDIVDIDGGTCKYNREVCSGVADVEVGVAKVGVVCDIIVTSGDDIVVGKKVKERLREGRVYYNVCWYKEDLFRSIKIPIYLIHYIFRPYLTTHGEYVYITDEHNTIYEIPGHNEHQTSEDIDHETSEDQTSEDIDHETSEDIDHETSEDIEHQISEDIDHQTVEDISQYLLLSGDDNEVVTVLGVDISDNSFMVFGIIPGRQSFGFIHYEK